MRRGVRPGESPPPPLPVPSLGAAPPDPRCRPRPRPQSPDRLKDRTGLKDGTGLKEKNQRRVPPLPVGSGGTRFKLNL
ncbi:hypothetical protein EOT10_29940 [Streptomyces antnestii]|uniref:Uncharacterized protein n=1 Tax=Streptomyces antnestii TaxID=2494256 RepID=A0A437PAB7_9ACTN|nr:hypothetical protein EOT10_29940 [Streptomyces sp. San01]